MNDFDDLICVCQTDKQGITTLARNAEGKIRTWYPGSIIDYRLKVVQIVDPFDDDAPNPIPGTAVGFPVMLVRLWSSEKLIFAPPE